MRYRLRKKWYDINKSFIFSNLLFLILIVEIEEKPKKTENQEKFLLIPYRYLLFRYFRYFKFSIPTNPTFLVCAWIWVTERLSVPVSVRSGSLRTKIKQKNAKFQITCISIQIVRPIAGLPPTDASFSRLSVRLVNRF